MIRVIKRTRNFRVSITGKTVVINFHRRFASLFVPLTWEYTHASDISLLEQEANLLTSGQYQYLSTLQARRQVESVPADSLGIRFV